jgi:hypothetical protein
VDDVYIRSDAAAPYNAVWNASGASEGPHVIRARAYDNEGNFADATITVDVGDADPPSVSITSPANGATVSGNVGITVSASDTSGIARVWFYVDDVYIRSDAAAPYNAVWNATGASQGAHVIRARAYDNAGNFADTTITVNVGDATPPQVTITSPGDGATVSGNVVIDASASDDSGIQRVWFYVDNVYLRSDAAAPYNAIWNAGAASPGSHVIRVRAYDNAGNFADTTITVTVE